MAVSTDDVRNIALLARLAIDEERMPALVQELNGILGHMDVLQAVSMDAVLASEITPAGMPLRLDDAPSVTLLRERAAFAPAFREGFFLVPRLATHGDAATGRAVIGGAVGERDASTGDEE